MQKVYVLGVEIEDDYEYVLIGVYSTGEKADEAYEKYIEYHGLDEDSCEKACHEKYIDDEFE